MKEKKRERKYILVENILKPILCSLIIIFLYILLLFIKDTRFYLTSNSYFFISNPIAMVNRDIFREGVVIIGVSCLLWSLFRRKGKNAKPLIMGFIILLLFILLRYKNFGLFEKDSNLFQEALNFIFFVMAVYILLNLRKSTRLGMECMNVPKGIAERGFSENFILSEIKIRFQKRLNNTKRVEGILKVEDLVDKSHKKLIRKYFEDFLNDVKEIRGIKFFEFQLPKIKSSPISKLEIKFGEDYNKKDKNHLHASIILDRRELSNIVIEESNDEFYEKFIEWIVEIAEVVFLKLIPPCLRLSYYYVVHRDEMTEKFKNYTKNKLYNDFDDIFDLVREGNRRTLSGWISKYKNYIKTLKRLDGVKEDKIKNIEALNRELEEWQTSGKTSKAFNFLRRINSLAGVEFENNVLKA